MPHSNLNQDLRNDLLRQIGPHEVHWSWQGQCLCWEMSWDGEKNEHTHTHTHSWHLGAVGEAYPSVRGRQSFMVRTTIVVFSPQARDGPVLLLVRNCVCVWETRVQLVWCVCFLCIWSSWVNLCLLCNHSHTQTNTLFMLAQVFTHCRGVWISSACQNEPTSQTTSSVNVTAIFSQRETHCASLSVPFENRVWKETNARQN